MQPLTIALGNYGLTKPIKQGDVAPRPAALSTLSRSSRSSAAMRRMCRGLEFDICEMAFTTYVCARAVRQAVHRHPGVRDPEFPSLGDLHQHQIRDQGAEGPRGTQGRRQSRLHRHHRTLGARRPADRVWRRPRQDHLGADRRRARGGIRRARRTSTTSSAASRCASCCCPARSTPRIGEIGVEAPEIKPLIPERAQRRLRLFPQDRHLSDQSWRRHQGLACSRRCPGSPTSSSARSRRPRRSI